ncbi:sensor domain-containing protein [Limisalsivibrio acetivorans]|uniref:sensor domain-containing protein n=1 Tax=Limisalsivibrio acetivorans TaxID=1304888 RepID=UPI0003B43086|nr:sensor domain-containing diguanylate cyclase [Limisalsivibrio acetivorans]
MIPGKDTSKAREEEYYHRRFDMLFNLPLAGFAIADAQNNWMEYNRKFTSILGYSEDELQSVNFQSLTHPDDLSMSTEQLQRIYDGDIDEFTVEKRYIRKDKAVVHCETSVKAYRKDDGEIDYFVIMLNDITEKKLAEGLLGESNKKLEQKVNQRTAELHQTNKALMSEIDKRKRTERNLHEATETFMAMYQLAPDAVFIESITGEIIDCNRSAERISGYSREELIGMNASELVPEDFRPQLRENLNRILMDGSMDIGARNLRKSGESYPADIKARLITLQGVKVILVSVRDMSEYVKTIEDLRDRDLIFNQLMENISSVFWLRCLKTGRHLYVSPAYEEIWGRPAAELYKDPNSFIKSIHPDDLKAVEEAIERQKLGGIFDEEFRIIRPDGDIRWIWAKTFTIPNSEGKSYRLAGTAEDITELKIQQEEIRRLAMHDPMTGLPNRALLMDRLEQSIERSKRNGTKTAVLFIDLDNFKPVNDQFGHRIGDKTLIQAADRIKNEMRSVDTAARVGGDEFVAVIHDIGDNSPLLNIASRIQNSLLAPFVIDNKKITLGASIGISIWPDDSNSLDELLVLADKAMYTIKKSTKNGIAYAKN